MDTDQNDENWQSGLVFICPTCSSENVEVEEIGKNEFDCVCGKCGCGWFQ